MKIRELYFRMNVLDQATKRLTDTKEMAEKVGKTAATVETRVNDRASVPLNRVATAATAVQSTFSHFAASSGSVDRALNSTGDAGAKAASGMDRANQAASRLASGLGTVQARAAQAGVSVEGMKSKLDQVERGATKIAASTGAIVGLSVYKAADYEELLRGIEARAQSPEVAAAMTDWVKEGAEKSYSSQVQRARAAATLTTGAYGGLVGVTDNADMQTEFLEQLEKTLAVQGAAADPRIRTLGDAENLISSFTEGNVASLNKLIPGFQMSNQQIAEMREEYRRTMPELKNFNDQQIDLFIGMKEGTRIMQEANAGKEPIVSAVTSMRMAYEKLTVALGTSLIPSLELLTSWLGTLAEMATKYPNVTKYVAFGLALAFMGATSVVVASQVLGAMLTLGGLAKVAGVATAPLRILTAAQWLFNLALAANPIGVVVLAAAALVAILVYLAYRTGALAKAWEYLKSIDLGGALSSGLDAARDRWDGFLAFIEQLDKKLGSLSLGSLLKGAVSMAISISPAGVFGAILTQKIPGLLTWIWDSIVGLGDDLEDWLKGLIPDWLTQIVEWLKGAWGYLKDLYGTFQGWYDRLKQILFGGYDEEGKYEAGLGEEVGGRIVEALRGAPLIGGQVTGALGRQSAAEARAQGLTETQALAQFGIRSFDRGDRVTVNTYAVDRKSDRREELEAKYGQGFMTYPDWLNLPVEDRIHYEALHRSMTLDEARAAGYDIDLAKAMAAEFGRGPPGVPAVEEPVPMQEGVAGTATPPKGVEVGAGGVVLQLPGQSAAEIAAFSGGGTAPSDGIILRPEDVGLEPAKAEPGWFERQKAKIANILGASQGGPVIEGGLVQVHEGEQIPPARVVVGGETVLEQLVDLFTTPGSVAASFLSGAHRGGSFGGGVDRVGGGSGDESAPPPVSIHIEKLVHIDRVESSVDIDDIVWKIRSSLDNLSRRGEGQYMGGGW